VYIRLHGPKRWYRYDYSKNELMEWAHRIKDSGAKRAWIYFNNDNDAHAPKNAAVLRRMLKDFDVRSAPQRALAVLRLMTSSNGWVAVNRPTSRRVRNL
jgi:uncharacterized protein YecE (DUF72 family)